MASSNVVPHVQAKFITSQPQFAVPDSPFSVPSNVTTQELNDLITSLLTSGLEDEQTNAQFDFLIQGEFLRTSLETHMENKEISTETVVEIEYVERHPAPEPEDSLKHDDWVAAVRASGDFILTGCYDNTVRIWNTEGELLSTMPAHSGPVKCLSWIQREDENSTHRFVSGSHDETLLIWEWNQDRNSVDCLHACKGHAGSVDCVALNASKTKICSGSWDKMLKIWSTVPGEDESDHGDGEAPPKKHKGDSTKIPTRVPLMTLSGHNEGVSAAAWLSESEVATASWDHTIRLWDVEVGQETSKIDGTKVFLGMSLSPVNNLLITASADRHIRLFDPRSTDGAVVKAAFTSHNAWVSSVHWSQIDDKLFVSGGYDNLVKLWDTRSPKAPLYDLVGQDDKVLAVDWSIPEYMMSGGADNHLRVFKSSAEYLQKYKIK